MRRRRTTTTAFGSWVARKRFSNGSLRLTFGQGGGVRDFKIPSNKAQGSQPKPRYVGTVLRCSSSQGVYGGWISNIAPAATRPLLLQEISWFTSVCVGQVLCLKSQLVVVHVRRTLDSIVVCVQAGQHKGSL